MSIRERLFTRDIAHIAAERRERVREEELQRDRAAAAAATAPVTAAAQVVENGPAREPLAERPPVVDEPQAATPTRVARAAVAESADRVAASAEGHAIFPGEEAGGFRSRWEAIQTGFVDEPRAAVEQADELVAQVVTRLAEVFSNERAQLETQWDQGDNISTEDLRLALKRYRSFFDRLLSV
jgi:hypothetical protein